VGKAKKPFCTKDEPKRLIAGPNSVTEKMEQTERLVQNMELKEM
jgi:hypothetical protein